MALERKAGHFTFRTAAVFFVLSAIFELFALGTPVPLFGALREGGAATVYHLVYAVLFAILGAGLWRAKSWTCALVLVTAALYTLDKAQLLLSDAAMEAVIAPLQAALEAAMPGIGREQVSRSFVLLLALFVLGWWGFALYTWWRRDYFRNSG